MPCISLRLVVLVGALALAPVRASAAPIVLDFENLNELTVVGSLLPGVTFSNATVLTSGAVGGLLNEFDFPPRSGFNVIFDDGGPMRLDFAMPILAFGGYFTYATPVTIQAFNAFDGLLGSVTSAFGSNTGLSGDEGSAPNELLALSLAGISYLTIAGELGGGSFILDDVSFEVMEVPQPVAEPATLFLFATGCAAALCQRSKGRRARSAARR